VAALFLIIFTILHPIIHHPPSLINFPTVLPQPRPSAMSQQPKPHVFNAKWQREADRELENCWTYHLSVVNDTISAVKRVLSEPSNLEILTSSSVTSPDDPGLMSLLSQVQAIGYLKINDVSNQHICFFCLL
jgi:hypothetical protein